MRRHDDELEVLSLRRQREHGSDDYQALTVQLYDAIWQAHDDGMDTAAIAAGAGLPVVTVVEYLARRGGERPQTGT